MGPRIPVLEIEPPALVLNLYTYDGLRFDIHKRNIIHSILEFMC